MTPTVTVRQRDGTLVKALDSDVQPMGWTDELDRDGHGSLWLPTSHADAGLLTGGRVVTVDHHDDGEVFGWLLTDSGETLDDGPGVTVWSGRGLWALLGGQETPSAVVIGDSPESGLVTYGWVAKTWDDSSWNDSATSGGTIFQPASGTPNAGDRWPDKFAEWIQGEAWIRQTLDVHGPQEGVSLWLAGRAQVWFGGEQVADAPGGEVQRATLDLTGDDVLAIHVDSGRYAAWTIVRTVDGEDEVLYRSSTGAPFDVSTAEVQEVRVDIEQPPWPWGSSYPSTGPDNLQGYYQLTVPGHGTAQLDWDEDSAAEVQSALNAISGVTCTVSGSDPWTITFDESMGNVGSIILDHSELRHDHGDTYVKTVTSGESTQDAKPAADWVVTTTEPDGVTWGYVADAVLTETQDRGVLPGITTDTTAALDSGTDAWDVSLPLWSGRVGEQAGDLLRAASESFDCHAWLTPGLVLKATNGTGQDLSGSVTLDVIQADVSHPSGEDVTDVYAQVDGGAGWIELAGSPRRELAAQFGTAKSTGEIVKAAERAAAAVVEPWSATAQMADGRTPRPYTQFVSGDVVTYDGQAATVVKVEVEVADNHLGYRVELVDL